jgi:hypothetical protein
MLPTTKKMSWIRDETGDLDLHLMGDAGEWLHYSEFPELAALDGNGFSLGWKAFSYLSRQGWVAVKEKDNG